MKRVWITSVDGYNCIGENVDDIYKRLVQCNFQPRENENCIPNLLAKGDMRGKDGYSIAGLTVSKMVLEQVDVEAIDTYAIGTVMATEDGAMKTNLKFLKQLYEEGTEYVSPKLFSATVSNSCLGSICIKYQLKGPSTMFVNTSPILYGLRLIESNKAKAVFAAVVDEYDRELFDDYKSLKILSEGWKAGAAGIFLESDESVPITGNQVIGEIVSCSNVIDGRQQYRLDEFPIGKQAIERGIIKALDKARITIDELACIFTASNSNSLLYQYENEVIRSLSKDVKITPLNSHIHMNGLVEGIIDIGIALKCLKEQRVIYSDSYGKWEQELTSKQYVMVNTLSRDGNWSSIILRGEKNG